MQQAPDIKLVSKLQKLLALARDGGATEQEANSAMAFAQRIMEENNLTMATVEAAGGRAEDGQRTKESVERRAMYKYQRDLMAVLGTVNFCHVAVVTVGSRSTGYRLVGRQANVVACQQMFDYLNATINRMIKEELNGDNSKRMSRYAMSFCEGASDRLQSRLSDRHEDYLRAQAAAAKAQPAGPTGNALVVVMRDYAQTEDDLNMDFRRGWAPGTTAARNAEWRRQREAATAQHARRTAELRLQNPDASDDVIELLAGGMDLAQAMKFAQPKKETDKQKAAREAKERRQSEAFWRKYNARHDNRDHTGYRRGEAAGDRVGLDPQVGANGTKAIR